MNYLVSVIWRNDVTCKVVGIIRICQLNINGRICVYFSIFWGILAIFLMTYINKKVDKLLIWLKEKINIRALKTITIITIIVMAVDCVYTGVALRMFYARIEHSGLIKMQNGEQYLLDYEEKYKIDLV